MDAFINLLESLVGVFWSLLDVVVALIQLIVPWLPFLAWVGFWAFAVDWRKAYPIIQRGGLIGVLLLMFLAIMVWGAVAPPPEGTHYLFGLTVSNYAGKLIYVTALTCVALLCGSVQMSGSLGTVNRGDDHPASGSVPDSAASH